MFLNRLSEEEKVVFLELAHHIARSDDDFSKVEEDMINGYCMEMQINNITYNKENFLLENLLEKITTVQSQKIIVLEIMALVYSDNELHQEEEKILNTIVEKFKLNSVIVEIYTQWSKSILALTIQGEALLHI